MYSFTVTFDGVGHPPVSNPSIGFCTQIAFFEAKNNSEMPIDSMSLYGLFHCHHSFKSLT